MTVTRLEVQRPRQAPRPQPQRAREPQRDGAPVVVEEQPDGRIGKRRWIVLTKDDRIRYRVTERTAILSARVRAFVLTSTQLQGAEMAAAFIKALPRIKRIVASNAASIHCPDIKNWKSRAVVSSPPVASIFCSDTLKFSVVDRVFRPEKQPAP